MLDKADIGSVSSVISEREKERTVADNNNDIEEKWVNRFRSEYSSKCEITISTFDIFNNIADKTYSYWFYQLLSK